jgi:hypothetical protein
MIKEISFGSKYVNVPANNDKDNNSVIIIIIIIIIIRFNSYLFMCKLDSTEANYKVSTGTEEEKIHIQKNTKNKAINIIKIIIIII